MEAKRNMGTRSIGADECDRLLQELIQYYRHAAVGRRITGIIHTINTPLQVILMQSELMERKLKEEQENFAPNLPAALQPQWQAFFHYRQKKNRQLQEVSANLQQLVHWLKHRTFHEDHHGIQEIDLNELLLEELEGYQAELFYKHRVTKRFQWLDRLPPISGFYVDFSQSFCNLIDNALEALQGVSEPILTITTSLKSGRRVIAVGDNGPGIPAPTQDQIFKPFFSTKSSPEKPRAGLGLFLTRRLLTPYGGEVTFESRPGQTWFRLELP
jgi:signal transduction histidine kinase